MDDKILKNKLKEVEERYTNLYKQLQQLDEEAKKVNQEMIELKGSMTTLNELINEE